MKKWFNNIVSIFISAVILCTTVFPVHATNINQENSIDALDILVAAYKVLDSEIDSVWDEITDIKSFSPLYDYTGEKIIAYYVGFVPSGYVIVNNNKNNPVVLEFSQSDATMIEDMLVENKNICYTGSLEYSDISTLSLSTRNSSAKNFSHADMFYDMLSVSDYSVASSVSNIKNEIINMSGSVIGSVNSIEKLTPQNSRSSYTKEELRDIYEMIHWDDLPSGTIDRGYVTGYSQCTWGTDTDFTFLTDDNGNDVRNHCTSVAAFNIITYYMESLNESDLYINDDRDDTFLDIYNRLGAGPVLLSGMNSGLIDYVDDLNIGLSYEYSACNTYTSIMMAIEQDHVCGVLLSRIQGWHTVMAMGYHQLTSSGEKYLRIVDGWEDSTSMYILYSDINVACEAWGE